MRAPSQASTPLTQVEAMRGRKVVPSNGELAWDGSKIVGDAAGRRLEFAR